MEALIPLLILFLGEKFRWPMDRGWRWPDGRRLFGVHKTLRGIGAAVAGGAVLGPLLGLELWQGAAVGLLAMAGDLLSSFIKRRLRDPEGAPEPVLDQIFEALFPAIFLASELALSWWQTSPPDAPSVFR